MRKLYIIALILISAIPLSAQVSFKQVPPPSPAPGIIPVFAAIDESAIAFADIDGNGTEDALLTGLNSANLPVTMLYKNDGSGNYIEVASPFDDVSKGAVAFADVDGNGTQDVMITGLNAANERIAKLYINDGSGAFTEATGQIFDGVFESAIAFADVDGVGGIDLFITGQNTANQLIGKLYLNDGQGVFTEKAITLGRVNKGSVAFADVDGVNGQDILITGFNSINAPIAELYLNDGAANFTKVNGTPFVGVRDGAIAFADVDNVASQDVLITGYDSNGDEVAKLYTNNGTGTFSLVANTPFDSVGFSSVAFADVDGANGPDVIVTGINKDNDRISKLYTNNGSGIFTLATGTPFNGVSKGAVSFADIDGNDGKDLIITGQINTNETIAKIYTNDGSGSFIEATGTPFSGVRNSAVAFADVDGDGHEDALITGRDLSNAIIAKLYSGDGNGDFTEVSGTPFTGVEKGAVAFADVDGVNGPDVLITGFIPFNSVTSAPEEYVAKLYLNNGSGSFVEKTTTFPGLQSGTISFADIDPGDGDDRPDLLLTGFDDSFIQYAKLYQNDGSGNFSEITGTPFNGVRDGSVAFADLDGAGGIDVMITGRSGSSQIAELYINDGNGLGNSFTEIAAATFEGVKFSSIAIADVDGINGNDLFITGNNGTQRTAKLYKNNGDQTFSLVAGTPFTGVDLSAVAFAEIDNAASGGIDLMITGATSTTVSITKVYTNDGTGAFTEVNGLPFEGVKEGAIAFADVAGSSLEDVVITGKNNAGLPTAFIYRNTTSDVVPTITSAANVEVAENVSGTIYSATADEAVTFTLGTYKDEEAFTLTTDAISFTVSPDFEAPEDANTDNVYFIDVIATNGAGNSTTKEVAITVTDIDEVAPIITSPASVSVEENISTAVYTATADEAVTFTLGTGKDESLFSLSTAAISFVNAPDFENPVDGNADNSYLLDVIATDAAGNTSAKEVTIIVTDVDEPGPVFTSAPAVSVEENITSVVYTATTDIAATFSLGTTKDEALFSLATDAISFVSAPDFENAADANADNEYLLDVIATDGDGNSTTLQLAITVTDVDEAGPVFTSAAAVTVQENITTVVYTAITDVAATFTLGTEKDEELFTLSTDAISFTVAPDFETPLDANSDNVYVIDIIATDGDGFTTTKAVAITVTDLDEVAPVITSAATASIAENSTGTVYTAEADEEVTFTLGASKDEALFTLSTDAISFISAPDFETPLDGDANNVYLIDVIATDTAGNATTSEIAITVTDVEEPGPVFTSGGAVSVEENVTTAVYTATTDIAATYTLGNSKDEALFTLVTDALSFTIAPDFETPLDANTDNVYEIDIIATDGDGFTTTKAVMITVTDVDEVAPTITSVATASVEENSTGIVYTATADEEVTFSLGNSKDEALFALTTDAVSFINAPDFETPLDADANNVYLLDIIATDAAGNATTKEIAVTVTDIDETGPVFTSAEAVTVEENVTAAVYNAAVATTATFTLGIEKDEALFTLSNNAISFKTAPDFENPLDADANNVYLLDVIATDEAGNASTLALAITVTDVEEAPLAVKEDMLFSIYPNPFKNKIVVAAKSGVVKEAMISITDLSGKHYLAIPYNGTYQELDLSSLKAGMYIISVPAAEGLAHYKLVKE